MVTTPVPGYQPTEIGPFRILGRLGEGGMGAVYRGQHQTTGAHAAIKVIRPEHTANPEFRARLRHEVAAASRVPRFCTAPVLAADLEARLPWVATEYIDAPTLDVVLLEHGRLTGSDLEAFAVGVAVALRAIHEQGIIHRDLKPSNVLVTPLGPRVIDFGIARLDGAETRLTRTGVAVGTPANMAPEQVAGHPLTAAVDVFAWASLVTYAGTGRSPFGTGMAALRAIVHDPPDLGDLPPSLRDLVAAAFHKHPAHRPSAASLVDRLSRTAAAATAQVMATAAAVPSSQPTVHVEQAVGAGARRPRRMAAVATAAALAVAAAAVMTAVVIPRWLSSPDGEPDPPVAPPDPPPFGTQIGQPLGGTDTIMSVAVSEVNGTPVALAAGLGAVQVWDLDARTPIGEPLTGHEGSIVSVATGELDGTPIAVSAGGDGVVPVWDLTAGEPSGASLEGTGGLFGAVALGVVDGTPVAITSDSGSALRVWDLRTRQPIGEPLAGHTGLITEVAIGELDGAPIAVSASEDATMRIWDLHRFRPLGSLLGHAGAVNSVAIGERDGVPIAVSAGDDETVRVWDLRGRQPLGEPLTGHTGTVNLVAGFVNSVAIGEVDGTTIAVSASSDETLRAWNLDTHQPLGEPFTGHTGFVNSVAIGQVDGVPVAVSGSHDNTLRIWSLAAPDLAG